MGLRAASHSRSTPRAASGCWASWRLLKMAFADLLGKRLTRAAMKKAAGIAPAACLSGKIVCQCNDNTPAPVSSGSQNSLVGWSPYLCSRQRNIAGVARPLHSLWPACRVGGTRAPPATRLVLKLPVPIRHNHSLVKTLDGKQRGVTSVRGSFSVAGSFRYFSTARLSLRFLSVRLHEEIPGNVLRTVSRSVPGASFSSFKAYHHIWKT